GAHTEPTWQPTSSRRATASRQPSLFDPDPPDDGPYWPWVRSPAQPTTPAPAPVPTGTLAGTPARAPTGSTTGVRPRRVDDPTVVDRTTTPDYDQWLHHVRAA